MPYTNQQIMIDRFGQAELVQLTDRIGAGVLNANVFDAAVAETDAEIDAYLQTRYALPLASVPLLIQKLARELTRFYLYDDNPPETVADRYRAAIKTLEQIAKGTMQLGLDALATPTAQSNMPKVSGPERIFDRNKMGDF